MKIIDSFMEKSPYKNEYKLSKSIHAVFMLLIIILSVIIEILSGVFFTNMPLPLLIGNVIGIIIFIFMLFLVKHGKLLLCGNIFIFAGFIKLYQFMPLDYSFSFYLQCLLGSIVGVSIYVKRYQLYLVVGMSLGFLLARLPYIHSIAYKSSIVDIDYIHQAYQATVGVIIFFLIVLFYDKIINQEIESTYELKTMAEMDALTKLYNRKVFNEKMLAALNKKQCLALLDIDHFKKINDEFGHHVGDEVLISFAMLLKSTFNESELVFRWGGEEFAVLSPIGNSETFFDKMEAFRIRVENYNFNIPKKITVSIGCICTSQFRNMETTMIYADRALYSAKTKGRNRTERIKNEIFH